VTDVAALTVRPIETTDVERLARMFERLSPMTVYYRFHSPLPRLPRSTLVRLADVDHCRSEALAALYEDEIVAVARYNAVRGADRSDTHEADLAIAVDDAWQHRGIGSELVRTLAFLAAARGFHAFVATILPENRAALALMRKLVPDADVRFVSGTYEARLPLTLRALG
jgi:RimJ/RimL family protein N-acetyltransferase